MQVYVGMDVHKKFTVATAMTEKGKILHQKRLDHGIQVPSPMWQEYLESLPGKAHVALEASSISYPIYEALEPHAASVHIAHPKKLKPIAEEKTKTDKIDSAVIAHLLRVDFLPEAHIPSREIRDQRELLRYRASLVHLQTEVKNKIHAVLMRSGYFYKGSDLFGLKGRQWMSGLPLREVYKEELQGYLRTLDYLQKEIKEATRRIHREIKLHPDAELLTSLPGIGKYLAALIYWEIGGIERFLRPKKLVGYTGLAPSVHSSGGRTFYGRITKEGNKHLRWALVTAAQKYGQRKGPLGDFFRHIKAKHGYNSAKVALARKLVTIIWHMLNKKEKFDEGRLTHGVSISELAAS